MKPPSLPLAICVCLCVAVWALTNIPLHAESLSEIQAKCLHREILAPDAMNQAVFAWQAVPGHDVKFAADTHSMEPNATGWDALLREEVKPTDRLQIGAIYAYRADWWPGQDIFHQLVRIDGDMLLFRGLGNARYDPWVRRDRVHAVVRRIIGSGKDCYAGGMNP